jgi:ATPase subunit of ABC transporter with duplicated ATPase domains
MNGVCSQIMHFDKKRLNYYGGNYDAFVKTRIELLENQMKKYNWEQDQIAHMKVRCTTLTCSLLQAALCDRPKTMDGPNY